MNEISDDVKVLEEKPLAQDGTFVPQKFLINLFVEYSYQVSKLS